MGQVLRRETTHKDTRSDTASPGVLGLAREKKKRKKKASIHADWRMRPGSSGRGVFHPIKQITRQPTIQGILPFFTLSSYPSPVVVLASIGFHDSIAGFFFSLEGSPLDKAPYPAGAAGTSNSDPDSDDAPL